ncbi:ABC-type dipeptide/oligopeptide/nickel transport system, permease component [Candidatus Vecturithrix granuli]|uniref:ABC-type dipeptide/oligopeptide/nickel transport system, permease component n=1 Tax=Vecturithrix granuli TaxID=1499967 RepID=A0A0S6WA72_VECG1|nr:ABC-type dipeptide/oligopeptide/nickel transport system, permease component [Candidatus Vecturithrix granuli]
MRLISLSLFRYILRRLVFLVFLILGVSLLVFLISHLVPADPVVAFVSQRNMSDPEVVAAFKAKWGLDQPLYMQYLIYVKSLMHGDLGVSIRTHRPVLTDLAEYFPATIELATFATIIAIVFGMIFGVISATMRNSFIDQILRAISVLGVSAPSFWVALVFLYVFYFRLGMAAGPGRLSSRIAAPLAITHLYLLDALLQRQWQTALDVFRHLLLPGIVLGLFTMGLITRTTRSSLLEVLSKDYIRTARAKGLMELFVILRHALGNAMIPVITVIGLGFGNLLGGTVLVETIFAWPGIGQYAFQSAHSLDFPSIVGVSLLIAVNYVVINLIIDLIYGVIDPRVRYD